MVLLVTTETEFKTFSDERKLSPTAVDQSEFPNQPTDKTAASSRVAGLVISEGSSAMVEKAETAAFRANKLLTTEIR